MRTGSCRRAPGDRGRRTLDVVVEVANLRSDMDQQTRDLTFRLIAAMVSMAALTWAAITYGT